MPSKTGAWIAVSLLGTLGGIIGGVFLGKAIFGAPSPQLPLPSDPALGPGAQGDPGALQPPAPPAAPPVPQAPAPPAPPPNPLLLLGPQSLVG